jgi:O-antigen/teichoic acid export membrane protein
VYSPKWKPALPTLYLLLLSAALSSVTGVLVSALYSLGRGTAGLRIAILWTGLTWLSALLLSLAGIGFEALGIAFLVGTLAALALTLHEIRDLGVLRFLSEMRPPAVGAIALAAGLYLLAPVVVRSLWSLLIVGSVAGIAGLAANVAGERSTAQAAIRSLFTGFSPAQPGRVPAANEYGVPSRAPSEPATPRRGAESSDGSLL